MENRFTLKYEQNLHLPILKFNKIEPNAFSIVWI